MTEIIHDSYQVYYDPDAATVTCAGSFRLRGSEYTPILNLLNMAADAGHSTLTLDLCQLQFLNSSGINTFSKFVIRMRQQEASQLVVKGNADYRWQKQSLKNLQRLLPSLRIELEL